MIEIGYKVGGLFIDDDLYTCFYITGLPGHGIWLTLHHNGWEAFVDDPDVTEPFWSGDTTFPCDHDIAEIVATYMEQTG